VPRWVPRRRAIKPIVDIRFNAPYAQIANSVGDEWAPTWADDGNLYTGNDDGSSFGGIGVRSVAFGKLVGDDPNNLNGATVSDLGEHGSEPARPDKGNWKTMNSYCVDGVLYMFVTRCLYPEQSAMRTTGMSSKLEHHQSTDKERNVDESVGRELHQADVSRPGVLARPTLSGMGRMARPRWIMLTSMFMPWPTTGT